MSTKVPYVLDDQIVAEAEILWEEPNSESGIGYFALLYVQTIGYMWTETNTRISERQRFSFDDFGICERWAEFERAALARLCAALVPELLNHSNLVIDRLAEKVRAATASAR